MTADFYTGHVVLERPGAHKVADLEWVRPMVLDGRYHVAVSGDVPAGSLRLGHITLAPEAFDRDTLYYATHNGGREMERFSLAGHAVDHGAPVSLMVTASTCVGLTEGVFEFGDADRAVRVTVERLAAAVVGMVTYREVGDSFFCRVTLSAFESDETRKPAPGLKLPPVGMYVEIV